MAWLGDKSLRISEGWKSSRMGSKYLCPLSGTAGNGSLLVFASSSSALQEQKCPLTHKDALPFPLPPIDF